VPVFGQLRWEAVPGWKMKQAKSEFKLQPGDPLVIPLQAEVSAGAFARAPKLTIEFDPGKFRNRTIEVAPIQLGGPAAVKVARTKAAVEVDGKLAEAAWKAAEAHALLGLPPRGGRGDEVRLLADDERVYLAARLDDPDAKVEVKEGPGAAEESRLLLLEEHVRIVLADGTDTLTFAVSPDQSRYHGVPKGLDGVEIPWQARAARDGKTWTVEMSIPRNLVKDWSKVKVNVVHRRKDGKDYTDWHLCPAFTLGSDPDLLPDFRPGDVPEKFARVEVE
jgi:hypothetical protein